MQPGEILCKETFLVYGTCMSAFLRIIILACSLFAAVPAHAQETADDVQPHDLEQGSWLRYTQGFRRDHHFALSLGITRTHWYIDSLGDLNNERFATNGIYSRFQYSFHIPIWAGFGYFLGSSMAYSYDPSLDDDALQPPPSFSFPGLAVGLVYNITPVVRPAVALDYNLERWNGLRSHINGKEDTNIHVTVEAMDLQFLFDIFYRLDLAFRLESHFRRIFFRRPTSADAYPVSISFQRNDEWYGMGIVFHPL